MTLSTLTQQKLKEFDEKFPILFDSDDSREGYAGLITDEVKSFLQSSLQEAYEAGAEDANDLLRSAYQIAKRKGKDTNWSGFLQQLTKQLSVHTNKE